MQGGDARRGLTRRQVLIGGAAVGAAAALGVTATGSPFRGGPATVTFWHLFGGGDGERLTKILADIDAEHADSDVRQLILQWGNPYYTKLALAAVGGSPPDVAIVHATRLPSFAPAGLLEELTPEMLEPYGLTGDRFLEKPWKSCQSGSRQSARRLRSRQGAHRQERPDLRDARGDAVAHVPDAVRAARRAADHRGGRQVVTSHSPLSANAAD
jgi:hypothetical protein